ncbi:MAG TPA: hypothetical protein VIY49_19385 [Bryobacteraceae bacterium]
MSALRRIIETLHPAYFDVVMATGIVAIAAHVEGILLAPVLLTYLNIVLCAALLAMNALRLVWQPVAFRRDLSDFERGPIGARFSLWVCTQFPPTRSRE